MSAVPFVALNIRVTPELSEAIGEAAHRLRISNSEFVRQAAQEKLAREKLAQALIGRGE